MLNLVGWAFLLRNFLALPLETPSFFSHHTCVTGSFGFFGWELLFPTQLAFGSPSFQLALHCLWKPQVFFPPHLCHWLFQLCWLGAPLANSACLWTPLLPTFLALPLETHGAERIKITRSLDVTFLVDDTCVPHTVLHGEKRIKSTKSLDVTYLVDDACVPIKIQKIAGNCPIN
jgi:hypothetical protein